MNKSYKEQLFLFYENCSEVKIAPNSLLHAYLAILNGDFDSAETVFSRIDSPRGKWGVSFVQILKGFLTIFPTYFCIRNFLEIDLDFLLKNNKIDYVEQCLGALKYLADVNQETYKFVARVMLLNKLYTSAIKYMEYSKKIYYNDPELHFMYAKYYLEVEKNYSEAYFYVNECLKMLPSYYPAQVMKQRIEEIAF